MWFDVILFYTVTQVYSISKNKHTDGQTGTLDEIILFRQVIKLIEHD